ncbi:hypothetical protein [Microbacterium sp. NPDC078849]|uniref:hypothetical protein n=1 Tax=unclassified Microbacterium TaxID=2609290 RepID=UPI00344F0BA7
MIPHDTSIGVRLSVRDEDPAETPGALRSSIEAYLDPRQADALREFYDFASAQTWQAKRDEELGRWRWPENPDYVALPRPRDGVRVVSESTGQTLDAQRDQYVGTEPTLFGAANAYFVAHPPREPWHDARPGEVWVIQETDMEPTAARVGMVNERMQFEPVDNIARHIDVEDPLIVEARRIWPEGGE